MDRRIVLVTGASRGIGRAAALALAKAGNHVICTARSQTALTELDDEINKATGRNATLVPLDLVDSDSIDRLAPALLSKFGRIDGFLGNAGVLGTIGTLETVTPQSFKETMDVNFMANWRLIRSLYPLLKASEAGRAVFVTSGAAIRPRAFWGPYAASKAALETMIYCFCDETEQSSVRINLFDPGATRTDMRFKAMPGEDPQTLPSPEEVALGIVPLLDPTHTEHGKRYGHRN